MRRNSMQTPPQNAGPHIFSGEVPRSLISSASSTFFKIRHPHSFIHSLIHSFTHSLIHSFIHSLIHSFIHSGYFYSVSSSPQLLLKGAPDTAQIGLPCRSFTPKRHRPLRAKDLPKAYVTARP